jgi:hypothetical protein
MFYLNYIIYLHIILLVKYDANNDANNDADIADVADDYKLLFR